MSVLTTDFCLSASWEIKFTEQSTGRQYTLTKPQEQIVDFRNRACEVLRNLPTDKSIISSQLALISTRIATLRAQVRGVRESNVQ